MRVDQHFLPLVRQVAEHLSAGNSGDAVVKIDGSSRVERRIEPRLIDQLFAIAAAVAIVVFASAGALSWLHAAIMIPAVAMGGYAGVAMAKKVPQTVLRWLVVAAGLGLAAYYFLTG